MTVQNMKLSDYDYHLPPDRIAQYPLPQRDSSRLLVIDRRCGEVKHEYFRNIVEYLNAGDVLVLNDIKVLPLRLCGTKPSGGKVEILLLKELRMNTWEALVRGVRQGKVILGNNMSAYVSRPNGAAGLPCNVSFLEETVFGDIKDYLNSIGVVPLPPYIKREAEHSDKERYQTVYARKEGAVASPTAGLHFTDKLLNEIRGKGVEVKMLSLHVGYGTFKPVLSDDITGHRMDEEMYEIPQGTAHSINLAKSEGRRIVAVGTTVTRALESSAGECSGDRIRGGTGKANIFVYPGYRFTIIDVLITNFHLPKSSPMILTSAFSGISLLRKAYQEAIGNDYRFFSYGDAMIIV
jgi:S-adenosylmethionine:tRNA ribosyltransferase-isomerase